MADNITLNSGSGGETLATDELAGGEHAQKVKLLDGTADSETIIAAGNGTATNALRVTIASDSTGQVALAAGSASVGTFNIGTASTAAAGLAKAEDAAHTSGDVGIMALAVRMDTPANLSDTDGDYEPLQVSGGKVWTRVEGYDADDAVASARPVTVGGVAKAFDGTDPGTVAEGDSAAFITDLARRQAVTLEHPNSFRYTGSTSAIETAEIAAAPAAGLRLYVTDVVFSADTAQTIKLLEDSGGTPADVMEIIYLAADSSFTHSFVTPVRLSEAVNLAYTTTAAVATSITVHGYAAP